MRNLILKGRVSQTQLWLTALACVIAMGGCASDDNPTGVPMDPNRIVNVTQFTVTGLVDDEGQPTNTAKLMDGDEATKVKATVRGFSITERANGSVSIDGSVIMSRPPFEGMPHASVKVYVYLCFADGSEILFSDHALSAANGWTRTLGAPLTPPPGFTNISGVRIVSEFEGQSCEPQGSPNCEGRPNVDPENGEAYVNLETSES